MTIKIIAKNFTASLIRAGQPVTVVAGEPFDFEDSEIADLEAAHGEDALRDPVDEGAKAKKAAKSKASNAEL